ncbi:MAG: hypothetical protein ACXVCP_08425 [Bdellovibrio sp.]
MKRNFVILIACSLNIFLGCTSNKNSSSGIFQSILPIGNSNPNAPSSPISTETPASVSSAEKIIKEVQENLNKESQYSLTNDDLAALSDAGVDQADLKGWVK